MASLFKRRSCCLCSPNTQINGKCQNRGGRYPPNEVAILPVFNLQKRTGIHMNPATPFDRAFEARLHRFDWTSLPAGDETLPGAAQARCRSCQSYRRLRILKRLQVRQPASRTRSPFPCKAPFSTKTGGILRAEAKTEFPLPVLPMHKQKASVLRWYSTCARPGGSLQNRSHTSASLRGKQKNGARASEAMLADPLSRCETGSIARCRHSVTSDGKLNSLQRLV